jgi:cytochrome c-type biogenesis protein CcmH
MRFVSIPRLNAVFVGLALSLVALVASVSVAFAASEVQAVPTEDDGAYVPGASRLEGRIMAPCCWTQTIDIHGSEKALELKREIRQRLRAGESPDVIEASLVERYGKRILAVPTDSPLKKIAVLLSGLLVVAGVGAVFLLRRWKQGGAPPAEPRTGDAGPDQWDKRVDEELEKLNDD